MGNLCIAPGFLDTVALIHDVDGQICTIVVADRGDDVANILSLAAVLTRQSHIEITTTQPLMSSI